LTGGLLAILALFNPHRYIAISPAGALQILPPQKQIIFAGSSQSVRQRAYSLIGCGNCSYSIWVKIGLLIAIISVNKDLAATRAFCNDA